MDFRGIAEEVEEEGFSTVEAILNHQEITALLKLMPQVRAGQRNLLTLAPVLDLARNHKLLTYVRSILGKNAFPFKATFFDKHPAANWLVPWHQDLAIPVQHQRDLPGWGPWSKKAGVLFVQPPTSVLQQILAIRVHLDRCMPNNGALKVLPKTHHLGHLSTGQVAALRQKIPAFTCAIDAGGIILMRPLLLHSSSKSSIEGHRRVIHFEYAAQQLQDPHPKLVAA